MANRFLNNITINDEYTLPSADGTADQIITTDGAGQLSFVDQSTVVSGASRTVSILVKNISSANGGVNLSKGDPVYIYGSVGASERLHVDLADAGDSSKMPCVALLDQDLSPNGEGTATVTGKLKNLITSPIDGATPTENDTIYVKSGGGLTLTKPTGPSNLIQNVGQVGRVSTSADGNIVVSAILRSNDVPNLSTGKIWVGDGNTTESTVVHLDEANNRLGVNDITPSYTLDVSGTLRSTGYAYFATAGSTSIAQLGGGSTTTSQFNILSTASGNSYIAATNTLSLKANNTTAIKIDNTGNVGIGTTGPDYKLEVSGTLGVSRTDGIIFAGSIGTGTGSKIVSNTSNDLIFSTALTSAPYTTTERVRILNNGNVGIGTDSPNNNLEIKSAFPGIRLNTTSTVYPTFGKIDAYNNTTYRGGLTWAHNPAQDGARITYVGFPSGTQTTGTFEVGSNFVDTSINNGSMVTRLNTTGLGIGTTSPNRLLTVQTTSTGSYIAMNASTGNTTIGSDVNGGFIVYDDTNSSYRMVINRSTGNVGIGTTSPSGRLTIGSGTSADNSTMFNVNGQYNDVGFNGGTSGLLTQGVWSFINSATWDQTRFYVQDQNNADSRLTFDFKGNAGNTNILAGTSTGKVGIGTTSPVDKLTVENGNIRLNSTSSYPAQGLYAYWNNGSPNMGGISWHNNPGFIGSEWNHYKQTSPYTQSRIRLIGDTNGGMFVNLNNSDVFTILASNGNVGIGSTSPASQLGSTKVLDISSTGNGEIILDHTDAGVSSDIGLYSWNRNNDHLAHIKASCDGATDSAFISFHTQETGGSFSNASSNERMRITSTGNVGIGTASPQEKLHVQNYTTGESHQAMFKGGAVTVGDYSYISLNNGYSAEYNKEVRLAAVAELSTSNKTGFAILTSPDANGASGHERLRVTADGNVGIGTTSPSYKLDVNGEARFGFNGGIFLTDDSGTSYVRALSNHLNLRTTRDQDDIYFSTGTTTTTKMFIQGDTGNVGIGTTNPSPISSTITTLDIQGSTGGGLRFGVTEGVESTFYTLSTGSTTGAYAGSISSMPLHLITANTISATILANGNFGIGTSNPSEKLEVNGTVKATAATDAYKGYIKSVITTGYSMKSASTAYQYIPYNSYTLTTLQAYYNRTVAAYNGRVKKIIVKRIDGASADATGMKFKKEINGTVIATEYTATVLSGSGNFQATYNFANSDFTFSAGDSIGVLMQSSGGTGMIGAGAIQIVLEYNIT